MRCWGWTIAIADPKQTSPLTILVTKEERNKYEIKWDGEGGKPYKFSVKTFSRFFSSFLLCVCVSIFMEQLPLSLSLCPPQAKRPVGHKKKKKKGEDPTAIQGGQRRTLPSPVGPRLSLSLFSLLSSVFTLGKYKIKSPPTKSLLLLLLLKTWGRKYHLV